MLSPNRLLFIACLIAILLVFLFSPGNKYSELSLKNAVSSCEGLVKFDAPLSKVFYSSKGNRIGVIGNSSELMVLLNDYDAEQGDWVLVKGRASPYSGACWVFPDAVEAHD